MSTMKTEMQQLKENADREKAKQTLTEIAAYMDGLVREMRNGHELHIRSASLEFGALWCFVLTLFTGPEILNSLSTMLFFFTMFRNWIFIYPAVHKASHEFDGCIKTLEILGMLDKGNKHRRKSKRYRRSYLEAYWEWLKNKKREEAIV